MSYSQNGEDVRILSHIGDLKGTILDLGANDGITLSNSRLFIERGWKALLVEPSKEAFTKCSNLYNNNIDVECINVGIGTSEGIFPFFESGTHLGNGDTALLSTLSFQETQRWAGTKNEFKEKECEVITFSTLLELSPYKTFDIISIDCEGMDYEILKQINLNDVGCRLIVIEHNNNDINKYIEYCSGFGFKEVFRNFENICLSNI